MNTQNDIEEKPVESPEDVAYILETVSDAKDMAKSVAEFRKTLIENGIPEDEAVQMTREYMQTVTNWKGMMSEANFGNHRRYRDEE